MRLKVLLTGAVAISGALAFRAAQGNARAAAATGGTPAYTKGGRLIVPADYREWVFLSSGIDTSYTERPVHQFDNVFAPRDAYRAFLKTGVWPDKTVLIVENRAVETKGSITRSGQFQTSGVIGLERAADRLNRLGIPDGRWM
ncbi:cytochrome P460 family protein [Sphingomonas naphthae]|uniref:Cytochrome P460 family protein n=1 Tax=Sphingomonas naphthae TaxID=1813468 RepID=A0ABY7TMP6_9SPHN|nr:cytochrome P460 family protein [Sphingomonas naphthae]WCT74506.1 cytochrome P460 family protein [Sphingomonas naphthae]